MPRCAQYTVTEGILRQTEALLAMEAKSRSRLNVKDDFMCALSCNEPRRSCMLSNSNQTHPSHWL